MVPLDAIDHRILRELRQDGRISTVDLAERVGLSPTPCARRLKRLEETGVIQANVAIVDPTKVGQAITIFVEVEVVSETAALLDAAKREFSAAPEVQQCYYVTGEADFILVITVATMADYEALTRRLFFANNNVKKFRTFVAMGRVKVGLGVPLTTAVPA